VSINSLVDELSCGRRHLLTQFRTFAGVPPKSFGFTEGAVHMTPSGTVGHAKPRCGRSVIMINSAAEPLVLVPRSP
jgi:hypothetical protein